MMSTLFEDIKKHDLWVVSAFASLGKTMDHSLASVKYIDTLFDEQLELPGKAKEGGLLSENLGGKLFSFASYVGETIIKNSEGAVWVTNDSDPKGELNISIKLPDESVIWPTQKLMKRFKNGPEDSLHFYASYICGKFKPTS